MKLTKEEKKWLVTNLTKMANTFLTTDDKSRLKVAQDALSALKEDKKPNRNAVRMMQQLCKRQYQTLVEKTIPAYNKRITGPEKERFYKPYLTSAAESASMILDLLDKVEGEL